MFWFINPHKQQLNAFFEWARNIIKEGECVFVDLPRIRKYFYFKFPLYPGDKPEKSNKQPANYEVAFKISLPQKQNNDTEWVKIFSSPEIQILESNSRLKVPPIRWGLNNNEKLVALQISRQVIKEVLNQKAIDTGKYLKTLPNQFNSKADVDVAIWTNGHLRGSALIENKLLGEGIIEGAKLAINNLRFRPLLPEEIENTRIEIVVISDLKIPLSKKEINNNIIYPKKGYILQKNERTGCFLPQVHNVRQYENLERFIENLAEEKSGLKKKEVKNAEIIIFETDDFIENNSHNDALTLNGPIVKIKYKITNSELIPYTRKAADWLYKIQNSDGDIKTPIDPTNKIAGETDWPRLAFTAWSLAEFGKTTKETKYSETANKSFDYLIKILLSDSEIKVPYYDLTLAYFGQLAMALGKQKESNLAVKKILKRVKTDLDAISLAQIASFLKNRIKYNIEDAAAKNYLEKLSKILKSSFEKNLQSNKPMNLAIWAELVNTFHGVDNEFYQIVSDWLKKYQLPNGAFAGTTDSDFIYTRGTGKIFEVLALAPQQNKESLEKALNWLVSMQYNEENVFFIEPEMKPKIIGGFRDSYFNHEAWIDGASHFILGSSRIINSNGTK